MSNIYLVTDYMYFNFIPSLIIPFLLGMILIGLIVAILSFLGTVYLIKKIV